LEKPSPLIEFQISKSKCQTNVKVQIPKYF
jgi:hypothetical protein